MRVCEGNTTVGTELIRIKQKSWFAIRCVPAIKRREFLVLETLAKEASFSTLGDGSHGAGAHQLVQAPLDTFASRHGRKLRHRILVLSLYPRSQGGRIFFHP